MTAPSPVLHAVQDRPVLVWRCERPWLAISSAPRGGGIGLRNWVLNATVVTDYDHPDPTAHAGEMAAELGLTGDGIGLLTAVDVRHEVTAADGGVRASVTTGANAPVWAAAPAEARAWAPGTINAVCWSPVRLSEAALVNSVATVAEAKAQALVESGVAGTGTVTDATAILCPADGEAELYGGPRSRIGAALARAVHAAVTAGLRIENPRHSS
ncbi:adenosylcobinamide amidohydrolase [Saccharopolyspora hirsuta]|uniref:Adenosylcobinamide amidohydrolase n=1 Tax=Saccharopolyspora hirsuta TaxID=1837 RepID=A0A5M7BTZ8_SACHI|nr:adenosylcobinamide amidohydrolase [Saccharopolyspora hirsuta]KAA5833696.1 adenosylcobinamide amidohydrolase [Saccharopolyspora hirsuta]